MLILLLCNPLALPFGRLLTRKTFYACDFVSRRFILHHPPTSIVRKVKFTLGIVIFLLGGNRCSQCVWVVSFITNKLPCSKTNSTFSLVCLCLNTNFLSAPKLKEPIAPSLFKSRSPSLCQAIPSSPS